MSETFNTLAVFSAMYDVLRRPPTVIELAKRLRISAYRAKSRLETLAINGYLERETTTRLYRGQKRYTVKYHLTKQGFQNVERSRRLRRIPDESNAASPHGGVRPPAEDRPEGAAGSALLVQPDLG